MGIVAAAAGGLLLAPGCGSKATGTTGAGGHGSTSGVGAGDIGGSAPAIGDSVLQHHRNPSRDGVYVQPALTRAAAQGLHKDTSFHAVTQGQTFAQPLYVDGMTAGKDVVLVATEQNWVYALDAATGDTVWKSQVGTPVALSKMGCGNIDPFGVTGTPIIDLPSRTLFLSALVDDGGPQHRIFALSLDDGSVKPGWPVDMANVTAGGTTFKAKYHGERGALALVAGTLYVPYGGLYGDCGDYHGWLVAVPIANPAGVTAWATGAKAGGSWAMSGVASDGSHVYIATGNTIGTQTWNGGEAILRFGTGAAFGGQPADYFAPANWLDLDNADVDIGGTGPIVFDLPGATPSKLTIALGKDGNAYLLDRTKLGNVSEAVTTAQVAADEIINAAVVYRTPQDTYVAFKGPGATCGGDLTAVRIKPGAPPSFEDAWCATQGGLGSPMVTTTDGHAEAIVWGLGAEGDGRLRGFDGDTGDVVFDGGGAGDGMKGVRRYSTAIAAKGRIFVAADNTVYAFTP
jgi:outer membrane protein assembly factor BamB